MFNCTEVVHTKLKDRDWREAHARAHVAVTAHGSPGEVVHAVTAALRLVCAIALSLSSVRPLALVGLEHLVFWSGGVACM